MFLLGFSILYQKIRMHASFHATVESVDQLTKLHNVKLTIEPTNQRTTNQPPTNHQPTNQLASQLASQPTNNTRIQNKQI